MTECALCRGVCIACGDALVDYGSRARMCSTCGFTAYIDDCWCDREQCEHTVWVPEIESWVRCTANTLMHTPDTRVLCPAHCGCGGGGANA